MYVYISAFQLTFTVQYEEGEIERKLKTQSISAVFHLHMTSEGERETNQPPTQTVLLFLSIEKDHSYLGSADYTYIVRSCTRALRTLMYVTDMHIWMDTVQLQLGVYYIGIYHFISNKRLQTNVLKTLVPSQSVRKGGGASQYSKERKKRVKF